MKHPSAFGLLFILVLGACAPMAAPERTPPEDEPPAAEAESVEPTDDKAPDDDPVDHEPAGEGADSGSDRPAETGSEAASRADRRETGAEDAAPDDTPREVDPDDGPSRPRQGGDGATRGEPEGDGEPEGEPARSGREPDPAQARDEAQPADSRQPDPSGPARTLAGTIELAGGEAEVTESVVYFVPDEGSRVSQAARDSAGTESAHAIVTRDKTLEPAVLAVPRGAEVRFPNEDPILHNLFSVSPGNRFDLGVYEPGESPAVSFDESGVVNIYCNVHHDMHAHVLVVDTPWRTRADAQGRFRLDGLPDAPGTLHVWHRQADRWSRAIDGPVDEPLDITLPVTRPKLPPHRDKTGQPYNRRDRDPYR